MAHVTKFIDDIFLQFADRINLEYKTKMKTHLENISYNLSDEYTKDYGKITYDKMEKYYDFGNVSYIQYRA